MAYQKKKIPRKVRALRDTIKQQVVQARDLRERLRMAVIGQYGRDSRACRMLDGGPKSDIDYSRKPPADEEE